MRLIPERGEERRTPSQQGFRVSAYLRREGHGIAPAALGRAR